MKRSQLSTFFLTLRPHDRTGQFASSAERRNSIVTSLKGNMSISVIIDSTRQGRFSEEPAQWILRPTGKRMDAPCCDSLPSREWQDPVVRLLPLGNGDLRAARRALEYRSSHRSLVGGALRIRHDLMRFQP